MTERGIVGETQEQILKSITSFALYGFPESHAASFALIAYASAYLKVHHPTAFYVSLLNAWPMGFYHPATLIQDAQRRGVEVRPIDVQHSDYRCTWETAEQRTGRGMRVRGAMRLGLRYVRELRRQVGRTIEAERRRQPFASVEDLALRCGLRGDELNQLAYSGTLRSFGLERREALWQAARLARPAGPLFEELPETEPSPLAPMSPLEETIADYLTSGLTVGPHPMAYARERLRRQGVVTTAELEKLPAGQRVRFGGAAIVRQRPGTAKGILFVTLEDETGMAQAIFMPDVFETARKTIVGASGMVIEGVLQKLDGSLSVKAERVWPLEKLSPTPSHDFR